MNPPRPARRAAAPDKKSGTLGQAVDELLRATGITEMMKHPEIYDAWGSTVGPDIAAHTRISRFQRGTLEIAVDSSALLNDIQFHKAALLKDLQRAIPRPFISNLYFVHKPMQDSYNDDGQRTPEQRRVE